MPRRKRSSPISILLIVLACILVLFAVLLHQPIASFLWRIAEPVVAWRDALSASQVVQLKAELASTTAALADRDALAAQNAQLKQELGRGQATRTIAAGVIMHPPGTPYDTLIVDAGEAQGVVVGAQVRAGALAIGTVDEVYASSARVTLYSSPGQSYQAMLVSADGTTQTITVEGQGSGSMQARVPASVNVAVGDRVEFPGLNGAQAGTISGVTGTDTDTFKTIYLHLPIDPFNLELVFIQA